MEEKKHVIIYLYKKGSVSLHYKALSTMSLLQDNFAFVAIYDPSDDLVQGFGLKKLPAIIGVISP